MLCLGFFFFFKPKCIVNKLTFGFFILIHAKWKVLHFVEQLILILTQAEKGVVNPFLPPPSPKTHVVLLAAGKAGAQNPLALSYL